MFPLHRVRRIRAASLLPLFLLAPACADETGPPENHPVPVLLTVDREVISIGEESPTLTVRGEGFLPSSRVRWNDADRSTTFVSAEELRVTLRSEDAAQYTQGKLVIYNPPPGGGTSGTMRIGVENPKPTLTAISPTSAALGAQALTITVDGTNFIEGSTILFRGAGLQTTRVSATRLVAVVPKEMLAVGGYASVTVSNPWPGGGAAAPAQFSVMLPTPAISAISLDTVVVGTAYTLRVYGAGYGPGAVVRLNGTDLATTLTSSSQLVATIAATSLPTPGAVAVTVFNPAPGGGTSTAATLTAREAPPTIALLAPATVAAGGPTFTLTINGSRFTNASQAHWNGAARTTQFVNGSTLRITVPAADIAAAATAQVTVVNPGSSGSSIPAALPILDGSSGVTSKVVVPVPTRHLVADPVRGLLYGSVPSTHATYGNRIVAIDPTTGNVEWSVPVGSDPNRMAIAGDGSRLYVILGGASKVARVNLVTREKDLEFDLADSWLRLHQGEDIEVLPGRPGAVVVSLRNSCCSPRHEGVALFVDGVRAPTPTQGHTGSNRITVSSNASRIYGYNTETTEFGLRAIGVSPQGLFEERVQGGLLSGFGLDIEFDAGRIYATSGAVVDAEKFTLLGTMPTSGIVRPDARNGRVHFLAGSTITVMHYSAFTPMGTLAATELAGSTALVRWGNDGLAAGGGTQVVILRSPLVGP